MQNHFAQFILKLQPPVDRTGRLGLMLSLHTDCSIHCVLTVWPDKMFLYLCWSMSSCDKNLSCPAIWWDSPAPEIVELWCIDIDCKYSVRSAHPAWLQSHPWDNARVILPYLGHPALSPEPRTTLGWEQRGKVGYIHLSKCQNLDNKPKLGSNYWIYFVKVLSYISILFRFSFLIEILTAETEC